MRETEAIRHSQGPRSCTLPIIRRKRGALQVSSEDPGRSSRVPSQPSSTKEKRDGRDEPRETAERRLGSLAASPIRSG
jgi:hypothetical protein